MKGFSFRKLNKACLAHPAGSADQLYGDSFTVEGNTVKRIGNNVTLNWRNMDFGSAGDAVLSISGHTPLPKNTIQVRITNEEGTVCDNAAEFDGRGGETQDFTVRVPDGNCTVSFIFLPGSSFDFESFRFHKQGAGWTEEE